MLDFFYRGAWTLAPLFSAGGGKTARTIRGRLGGAAVLEAWAARSRDTARRLIWFHAASVGEGRQAEAVIVRLRRERPDWQIACTYASASAEKFAAKLDADVTGYLPADTPQETGRALDALRPAALVFSATDLWPELARQAARRGIPTALISALLPPTSSRRGFLARALLNDAYRGLAVAGAAGPGDAEGLARLGVQADRIIMTGDTRHDAAAARAAAIDRRAPHVAAVTRADVPVLIAGSTWPSDVAVLLPALARIRADLPFALVIAPHEPDDAHLQSLERRLKESLGSARVARLSSVQSGSWDVCVVDRVGVLAELYAAAAIAFVGGGFHGAGLHSVIEPAALGVPVLFGPRWQSSRDAKLLLDAGGAITASDAPALAAAMGEWLGNAGARAKAGAAAKAVVDAGLGAAEKSVKLIALLVETKAG